MLLPIVISILITYIITSFLIATPTPSNCGEIGQLYLEMEKKNNNITDFDSDEWRQAIDRETELVNICYELN